MLARCKVVNVPATISLRSYPELGHVLIKRLAERCPVNPNSGPKADIPRDRSPKSANSGLMDRRRVPLFDHLVDIGELLGQPRFAKTLNHQLRFY